MKKIRFKLFASFIVVALFINIVGGIGFASANSSYTPVFYNENRVVFDVDPISEKGTILVQAQPLFASMGMTSTYNKNTKTLSVTDKAKKKTIAMTIGSKTAIVNGKKIALTIAPKMIKNSVFIPIRFIAEATGNTFTYDKKSNRLFIGSYTLATQDILREIEWGASIKDIKKVEKRKLLHEDKGFLMYELTLGTSSLPVTLAYTTDENNGMNNIFYSSDGSSNINEQYSLYVESVEVMNTIYGLQNKLYGDDDLLWEDIYTEEAYDDVYGSDYDSKIEMALLQKDLVLVSLFEYKDTSITVQFKNSGTPEKPKFKVTIHYFKADE